MGVSNTGEGYMYLLQKLGREEILEVLSEEGFCEHCQARLQTRIQNLINNRKISELSVNGSNDCSSEFWSADPKIPEPSTNKMPWSSLGTSESLHSGWQKRHADTSSPPSVGSKRLSSNNDSGSEMSVNDGLSSLEDIGLLGEKNEHIRFAEVGRKKNFNHVEIIDGKRTNVVQGLELHSRVFNAEEQKRIVQCVYDLQRMGQKGLLRARTYSEPRKWMRGKGRITLQFGCCYNYAVDKKGNPPGILRDEEVDPLPPLFKKMIKRMVRWHILPPNCVPNSCIVNIYEEGDCIPPHIDHHDFLRPFCTVSFLTECNILFGSNLKILNPGEFAGPVSIPLPIGSVLILSGNGADIAKHCVPGVQGKRISITFRKMDESKLPYNYMPEPELQGIRPLVYSPMSKSPVQHSNLPVQRNQHDNSKSPVQQNGHQNHKIVGNKAGGAEETSNNKFNMQKDDFPALGSLSSANGRRLTKTV